MNARRRVLVADDDADVLLLACTILEHDGYDVVQAHNGVEALMLAREQQLDLMVLDITMPGLDGLQVLTQLRAEGSDVPVLLFSARAQEADIARGFAAGAAAYVVKPFRPQELSERAAELLRD